MRRLATDDELRTRLGDQARLRQQQVFSVEAYVKGVTDTLIEAIDDSQAPVRAASSP
jgi:hypothetical protein